ncbi:hypothetical protein OQA88_4767 [Cercophora sp. LCS_1]
MADSAPADPKAPEAPYEPTILDVLVAKAMISKGLGLPAELTDAILDHAEYWPHSTTHVNYTSQTGNAKAVGNHFGGRGSENDLLVRTVPIGFRKWPAQTRPLPDGETIDQLFITPKPPAEPFDADTFQPLLDSPLTALAYPCRKIVFTIRSHDQGWGGDYADKGTYNHSWTWFEAGLERWCRSEDDGGEDMPSLSVQDLATVYPDVVLEGAHHEFHHPVLPNENTKIQCNVTVSNEMKEHRIEWRYNDSVDEVRTVEGAMALSTQGRGTGTGDGSFVRGLRLGDVITVWAKARFPGWVNYVESVNVDVYWQV